MPWEVERSLSGEAYSRSSVAFISSSSISSTIAAGCIMHLGVGAVVEDGDGAVLLAAGVVLEGVRVPGPISKSLFFRRGAI